MKYCFFVVSCIWRIAFSLFFFSYGKENISVLYCLKLPRASRTNVKAALDLYVANSQAPSRFLSSHTLQTAERQQRGRGGVLIKTRR
jgi:hypothetical protein